MKKLLGRLKRAPHKAEAGHSDLALEDSGYFSSLFLDTDQDTPPVVRWRDRQASLEITSLDRQRGQALFAKQWATDPMTPSLPPAGMARLGQFLDFVQVPANVQVIDQDEQGNYMLLVLEGSVAIDRQQPWGGTTRLAEARPGDLLGEMSFLDAGARFSACRTLQPTTLAVLDAGRLDDLIREEPQLASAFLASLARRLSLRVRHVSTCLSALLWQA